MSRSPFLIVFFTLLATPSLAASSTCSGLQEQVNAALQLDDVDRASKLLAEARSQVSSCSPAYVFCLSRTISRAFVDKAYRLSDQGKSDAELKPLLERAMQASPTWQASFALAEAEEDGDRRDPSRYDKAAAHYQIAINDIDEIDKHGEICEGEKDLLPDPDMAKLIYQRAAAASQLAANFVAPPTTRSGEPGGVFIESFRGVTPEAIPVPITFEFDSVTFTKKGEKAAAFLLGFLKSKQLPSIYLAGHTDSQGTAQYNCKLSKERLQAVRDFLNQSGYQGKIDIDPRGESDPVVLDDPGRYSPEEIAALNRRVELVSHLSSAGSTCASY